MALDLKSDLAEQDTCWQTAWVTARFEEDDIPARLKESGPSPNRLLAGSTGEMEMVAIIVIDLMPLKWLSENLISVTD